MALQTFLLLYNKFEMFCGWFGHILKCISFNAFMLDRFFVREALRSFPNPKANKFSFETNDD